MFQLLDKVQCSENVFKYRIHAPQMAKKARAGQFLMVRMHKHGERVPFTYANWDIQEGWIEFIFMVCGKTTLELSTLQVGDSIAEVTGPLGNPTELSSERWCVIGGGVGLAIAYPVSRALIKEGASVMAIMGARNKDLLILQEEFAALDLSELLITTDDGSCGEKGVVTAPLERLLQAGKIDQIFCVGPVPMMKFCSLTAQKYNIPITTSLNPIMVDGTGMCGCCRVEVDGHIKFACVDGPDFNGARVDWTDLQKRQAAYLEEEATAMKVYTQGACLCQK